MRPAGRGRARLGTGRGLIVILILVSAVNPVAINMFVPAMPSIAEALDTDLATTQLVISAYLFATAIAQLLLGAISDRFGRRPVLICGLALFAAAGVLCAAAPSIGVLILARVLQGAGGCAGIVLGRAIVRDLYERERAASMLGYVTMGFAVAPMVSPVIGGAIDDLFGWRAIFVFLAVAGACLVVVSAALLPETRRTTGALQPRPGLASSAAALVRVPAFIAYTLTCSFGTAVFFSFLGATPFIASEVFGMTATEFGLYFMPVSGGFILGNLVTARLAGKVGIVSLIIAGSAVPVLAVGAMIVGFAAAWDHPLAVFAPMYAVGFANGLTIANALAGAVSVRPDLAGAASGLTGSVQVGFGAVATVIAGVLLDRTGSVLPMTLFMLVLTAAALAAAVWTRVARTT